MTSVWFAASGSGEDGDEYDVHDVFATQEAAQAHCNRPDKPKWEHRYVQEFEVTGSFLSAAEREAIESAIWDYQQNEACVECADTITTLRGLLERLS